jgi:hypothetical protein
MRFPRYEEREKGVWMLHSSPKTDQQQHQKNQEKEERLTIPTDPLDYRTISAPSASSRMAVVGILMRNG